MRVIKEDILPVGETLLFVNFSKIANKRMIFYIYNESILKLTIKYQWCKVSIYGAFAKSAPNA